MKVAVVAHADKTLGDGLPALRRALARAGVDEPLWYEVPKAKKAPAQVERALDAGAELVFAWGGDGTVRRCLGVLAGTGVPLAVLPAGTANLFATNLGIPAELEPAVQVGLHGHTRTIDVGRFEKERFAVMAGAGFDAEMIRDADDLKKRIGRAAYLFSGTRHLRLAGFDAEIEVDGADWYEGPATCVLLGNLGDVLGGIELFPDARPDDGMLELGVCTAEGIAQWTRTLARTAVSDPGKSPFVRVTKARKVKVGLDRKVRYELDGGDRSKVQGLQGEGGRGRATRPRPPDETPRSDEHGRHSNISAARASVHEVKSIRRFDCLTRAGSNGSPAAASSPAARSTRSSASSPSRWHSARAARRPPGRARWPRSPSTPAGRSCSS
jgi:YegS/Rv2252/BmrU family lipid kinase